MNIETVILDFGHGGVNDEGVYTTAPAKMFKFPTGEIAYEGELNRQIGRFLFDYLKEHSEFDTVMTVQPDDPRDISLQQRVRVANSFIGFKSIFVSLHCNAGGGEGFEIFTTVGDTKADPLAESIANNVEGLYKSLNMKLRYDVSDGDKDKEINFYVLKNTNCPAVLLECGFFDHYEDFKKLRNPDFQSKLAFNIYKGILDYVQQS